MRHALCFGLATLWTLAGFFGLQAQEKDITDYAAQKAAGKDVKKIVFIADKGTHGSRGNHEFTAGAVLLARTINANYPKAHAVVYTNNHWPKDLSHADTVVVLLNHGGQAANNPAVKAAMERGAGFMAVHYSVEVNKGPQGEAFLKWMGGYYEPFWSVNPFWTPTFDKIPEHEITRGVKPFTINDEWYFHMRFVDGMKGVTPILSALPPAKTIRYDGKKDSPHSGNKAVFEELAKGQPQHVAWAYVRPDGGRGFGFTGYHNYNNLTNDGFRTILLNAVAWTTKLEVPAGGIPSHTPTKEELDNHYKEGLRISQ